MSRKKLSLPAKAKSSEDKVSPIDMLRRRGDITAEETALIERSNETENGVNYVLWRIEVEHDVTGERYGCIQRRAEWEFSQANFNLDLYMCHRIIMEMRKVIWRADQGR